MNARGKHGDPAILRPKAGTRSSLRRAPAKTYQQSSSRGYDSPEIDQIRESLMETPDFTGIEMPKLIKVQENNNEYLSYCIQNRMYEEAKKSQQLNLYLSREIQMQSRELEAFLATSATNQKFAKSKQENSKSYVFFMVQKHLELIKMLLPLILLDY
ncbi:hypothetical protein TVAG_014050 [Trichomonas vaginalis G3]|uniref:Uncharacterized protein n=1 Tax=Trichomonas vaginalis (strain ATCC PRA-98 / G3) TaxID=412133 RepID=A2DDF9_TRIV3|nr:hypothetical protein TVAGG3_0986220 [Trichomonas vaginalis G3]EAY21638.1 hypothetical protein TVAG_014050 [Trichomonas vaginalis G3]KAI5489686.1 hypothetical protein TVAGG3_0986220 [Trichomonas vaginalis G3]|eukprot:XP_001582624.1 hypothetical protein [Trichomonas vaginalis G3]